jgi:hypothetical protein
VRKKRLCGKKSDAVGAVQLKVERRKLGCADAEGELQETMEK